MKSRNKKGHRQTFWLPVTIEAAHFWSKAKGVVRTHSLSASAPFTQPQRLSTSAPQRLSASAPQLPASPESLYLVRLLPDKYPGLRSFHMGSNADVSPPANSSPKVLRQSQQVPGGCRLQLAPASSPSRLVSKHDETRGTCKRASPGSKKHTHTHPYIGVPFGK